MAQWIKRLTLDDGTEVTIGWSIDGTGFMRAPNRMAYGRWTPSGSHLILDSLDDDGLHVWIGIHGDICRTEVLPDYLER